MLRSFFYEQLNMQNREIDDQLYVAKMPQPHTVMITVRNYPGGGESVVGKNWL